MKFLLDENVPPSLALMLKNLGYAARHVFEIGYNNTPDFKIAAFAATSDEVIITHDTDFGTILALSGKNRPSVILFRWKKSSAKNLFLFLETHLKDLATVLNAGAFVVVDEHKMRVRKLPILAKQNGNNLDN